MLVELRDGGQVCIAAPVASSRRDRFLNHLPADAVNAPTMTVKQLVTLDLGTDRGDQVPHAIAAAALNEGGVKSVVELARQTGPLRPGCGQRLRHFTPR